MRRTLLVVAALLVVAVLLGASLLFNRQASDCQPEQQGLRRTNYALRAQAKAIEAANERLRQQVQLESVAL